MRVILMGAPGSGKGTQAKLISENLKVPHISTGDIFRSNIIHRTSLGLQAEVFIKKGQLVPDDITISMVEDRVNKKDCSDGFVIDGFPRNITQAKAFDEILEKNDQRIDRVIFLNVPECIIIERVIGRKVCSCCGAIFHSKFNPNKVENKCDKCQGDLIKREDDNSETIKNRIEEYINVTQSVLNFYSDYRSTIVINGNDEVGNVYSNVYKALIPI
ncbi:MAG: adenylate kinase [Clostridiaceae bacterium]